MNVLKLSNSISGFTFINLGVSYAFGRLWSFACAAGNFAYDAVTGLFQTTIPPNVANEAYFAQIQAEFERPAIPLPNEEDSDEEVLSPLVSHAVSQPIEIKFSSKAQIKQHKMEIKLRDALEELTNLKKKHKLSAEELERANNLIDKLRVLDAEELDYTYSGKILAFDTHFNKTWGKNKCQ